MSIAGDILVLFGLAITTIGVIGVIRFPDVYTQLHAASKAAFLGVSALLAAAATGGDGPTIVRAVLCVALLALTTPVASHVVAQAARRRGEPLRSPGAIDESAAAPGEDGRQPGE